MELFQTISQFQPRLPGWCTLEKSRTLAALVVALRPEVTVEIGVFGGSSLIPLALAHKAVNGGIVIGIDPWDTSIAVQVQPTTADKEWWASQNMNQIYEGFMREIKGHHLEKFTQIIRKPSAAVTPPNRIDLFHCDGGHDATAIQDVLRFAPRVRLGGIIVMDDLNAFGDSTNIAASRLETAFGCVKLYPLGTGAVFQRIR